MNYADHEKAVLKKVTDGVEVDPNMTWDGKQAFIRQAVDENQIYHDQDLLDMVNNDVTIGDETAVEIGANLWDAIRYAVNERIHDALEVRLDKMIADAKWDEHDGVGEAKQELIN